MKLTEGTYILESQGYIIIYNIYNSSYVKIKIKEIESHKHKIEKLLIEDGFLTKKNEELFLTDTNYNNKNTIYLKITNNCNLSCEFCCSASSNNIVEPYVDLKNFNIIFSWLKGINFKRLVLTGGEPLKHPEILSILKLKDARYKMILSTNGLLINKNNINDIAKNIDYIIISVENLFEDISMIKWLDNCINEFRKRNVKVALSYVVTKKNILRVINFLDYCNNKDVDISLKIVAPIGKAMINKGILLEEEEVNNLYYKIYCHFATVKNISHKIHNFLFPIIRPKLNCSAGNKTISINAEGEVYACHSLEKDFFKYGNIIDGEINEKKLLSGVDLSPLNLCNNLFCNNCEIKYFCGGNCYAERVSYGENKRCNCEFFKELIIFSLFNYDKQQSCKENLKEFISGKSKNYILDLKERRSWNELFRNQ